MENSCVLIGLDTSISSTGVSIYLNGELASYFSLNQTNKKLTSDEKFNEMSNLIFDVLCSYRPDIVVCELTSMTRNAVTQRNLTLLLGVVKGWCIFNDVSCHFFRASEWRSLVKDKDEKLPRKRVELKEWSKNKTRLLYEIEVENDDISDAILIGRAYSNMIDNLIK